MKEGKGRRAPGHKRYPLELNQMVGRNRLRMAFIIGAFALLATGLSGLGVYAIHVAFKLSWDLWLVLVLFWSALIIFTILRFILGWRWLFRPFNALPPGPPDAGLSCSLDAACIAAGLTAEVRLMVIPDADVNSFSLALPDGSYAVVATRGVEEKLPSRAREGMLAHEIGHIQAGDALLQTIYLCLVGKSGFLGGSVRKSPWSKGMARNNHAGAPVIAAGLIFLALGFAFIRYLESSGSVSLGWLMPVLLATLFLLLLLLLPRLMHPLFRLALDREKEYSADLLAVYLTRDPLAVYQAVEGAAGDVANVMLLPPYLDALLFCPVVDFTSYRPFRTQPTMQERMQRLQESFPALQCELQGRS